MLIINTSLCLLKVKIIICESFFHEVFCQYLLSDSLLLFILTKMTQFTCFANLKEQREANKKKFCDVSSSAFITVQCRESKALFLIGDLCSQSNMEQ